MEFWGIEVKPGQSMKCEPGEHKLLHLSQASLGEIKREKGTENIPIFVKANDQKLVLGTLSLEKCTQIQYDLVFEKDFELSHGSKNTSVFFVGYRSISQGYEFEDDFDDSESEDELPIHGKTNGKISKTQKGKSIADIAATRKDDNENGKLNAKVDKKNKEQIKPEKKVIYKHDSDSTDDSDEDEEMSEGSSDDGLEDDDESSEDDVTPEKVETAKKRKDASASKTLVAEKKAKVVTPAGNQHQKSAADGKKGGHVATPHPAKQGGKANQPPKTSGSATCKTCSKSFNSENALQAHKKAKHGATAK